MRRASFSLGRQANSKRACHIQPSMSTKPASVRAAGVRKSLHTSPGAALSASRVPRALPVSIQSAWFPCRKGFSTWAQSRPQTMDVGTVGSPFASFAFLIASDSAALFLVFLHAATPSVAATEGVAASDSATAAATDAPPKALQPAMPPTSIPSPARV